MPSNRGRVSVYLAGAIDAVADNGVPWRRRVRDRFGDDYDLVDPLAKYDVPIDDLEFVDGWSDPSNPYTVGREELVEKDKRALLSCDGAIVGYRDAKSIGTPMEVLLAWQRGLPVGLVVLDDTPFDAVSPWYQCHVTAMATHADMALSHVERQVRQTEPVATAVGRSDDPRLPPMRGGPA